ncbi:hypothetical protein DEI82_08360 [Curtobacterium sp. MCBD17_019]|nr:hypothetical protein DEI82_08360 [Curtobacterium sp. MCBD17_019]
MVKFEGVEYPGNHPALISEALFARAQQVRTARIQSREKPWRHTHYLKGSLYCGQCGEPLTFEQSRNRVGNLYDYFYCLGRQRKKNGCTFRAVQAHIVEQLVEDYWSTVTLAESRVAKIRRLVLAHIDTLMPSQQSARDDAERQLAELAGQLDRLMQAYYADAVPLERMKEEQARIAAAKGGAEAIIEKHASDQSLVLEKLEHLSTLLADAQRYYTNASEIDRRDLNQSVFDRLYIQDDEVVGSDIADPYRRLLSESLELDLARDRKRVLSGNVRTKDLQKGQGWTPIPTEVDPTTGQTTVRNASVARLSDFLTVERPSGHFPWERKNLGPVKDRGSNDYFLVAGAGFEPTTSGL